MAERPRERKPTARTAAHVREANEQLVFAMLRAQADGEAAAWALQEAFRAAELDLLTGLPKRALMLDRLTNAMANARRHTTRLALLFVDLNGFKAINDTFGHAIGDQVLQRVAHCLVATVRNTDTVSRHGGDEFLILLSEVSHPADARQIAAKFSELLAEQRFIGHEEIHLTASIGVSIFPDDGVDAATLIERADEAMYREKRHEPDPYRQSARLEPFDVQRRHERLSAVNEQLVLASLRADQLHRSAERTIHELRAEIQRLKRQPRSS